MLNTIVLNLPLAPSSVESGNRIDTYRGTRTNTLTRTQHRTPGEGGCLFSSGGCQVTKHCELNAAPVQHCHRGRRNTASPIQHRERNQHAGVTKHRYSPRRAALQVNTNCPLHTVDPSHFLLNTVKSALSTAPRVRNKRSRSQTPANEHTSTHADTDGLNTGPHSRQRSKHPQTSNSTPHETLQGVFLGGFSPPSPEPLNPIGK